MVSPGPLELSAGLQCQAEADMRPDASHVVPERLVQDQALLDVPDAALVVALHPRQSRGAVERCRPPVRRGPVVDGEGVIDVLAALHEMAAHVPEARDGGAQAKLGAWGRGGPEERERRPEVVVVAGEGVQRAGFADGRLEPLGKCQEVLRVAAARLAELSGVAQSLERVLAHRLEHGEAWLGVAAHQLAQQAVVDEGGERVQRGAAHRFGGIERAAAREHRQPGEQRPLTGPEQLVAPVDGGPQRVLTCGGVASAGRQQIQAVLQPREHRRRVEQLGPRGGQLERERKAVDGPADAGDRRPRWRRSARSRGERPASGPRTAPPPR